MPRRVRIATTSMATLEAYAPPYNLRTADPADNLALGVSMLEAAGAQGVDLAVLAESFCGAGMPGKLTRGIAEPIPGPAFDVVAAIARKHKMYVVAGFYERRGDGVHNVAALIDRSGSLIGKYEKAHPTGGEIDAGVIPGPDRAGVFDTDFGRLGLAICFDVNWPALWSGMRTQGAELVCWISAYEGGFPLRSLAWQHRVPIVTSVWPYHARIIDRLGSVIAQSSRWGRIAATSLNLDQRLFHTDNHAHLILPIQQRYGDRVTLTTYTEEHLFTLESNDPTLDEGEIVGEFGLVGLDEYLRDSTRCQQAGREPQAAKGESTAGPGLI